MTDIDYEKVSGQFVHYGRILEEFKKHGGSIMVDLYAEIQFIHEVLLNGFVDDISKFKAFKKLSKGSLKLVIKEIHNTTPSMLKERHAELVKENPNYIKEATQKFGKDKPDYFQ